MWFKNIFVYQLTDSNLDITSDLENKLQSKRAKPCAFQEMATYGFVAPYGDNEELPLVYASQGFYLIAGQREDRVLPTQGVKEALKDKVKDIEQRECRKVYKKEKDQLKDEIVQSLIPKTFARKKLTYAAIIPKLNLILVDSSSSSRAEELLSALRECTGSLPIRPLSVKIAISATLTEWIKNQQAYADFHILEDCELRDCHEEGGVIKCKKQDLTTEEILLHLKSGMLITSLALSWRDQLSFTLDKNLGIKRLKFDDILIEKAGQDAGDDEASQFDANFNLMMLTLSEFIPALIEALGGQDKPY